MKRTKGLATTWDKESGSYYFEKELQVDYLANCYYLRHNFRMLKGKKVLEVGSGSGQISAYLASRGAIVHLVDISKKSLMFSKRYFSSKRIPVKLYNLDAFSMNFPDESFDYVWNGGVIEHFSDVEKILMLKKMWRLVRPGGKILIAVPNLFDIPFVIAKKILELRNKWVFGSEDDLSIKKMRKLANLAGFKRFSIYAFNPIVGFWFFPYGREITDFLGLNTLKNHKLLTPFGHVIIFVAKKEIKK